MPLVDLVPFFRFVGALACPILYIVSFSNGAWVTTDNRVFGLWSWCYTNFTDQDEAKDYVNESTRCHSIDPGESPGYYEATRVLACFTLLPFIGYFFTCNEREGLGKNKSPVVVAAVACSMCAITLAVMGGCYEDDERWKNLESSLDWCYWVSAASCIMSFLMVFITYKAIEMKQNTASTIVTPAANRNNAPACNANTNNFGGALNAAGSSTTRGASALVPGKLRTPSAPHGVVNNQFPILELPRYGVLREPDGFPATPPPSYEDAIGSDSGYGPMPRVHLP